MALRIKTTGGQDRTRLPPQIAMAVLVIVVNEVFREFGYDAINTSGIDGKHSETSAHYRGEAMDWRTNHLDVPERVQEIAAEIKERLGPDFYILVHSTHLHTEWRPRGGYNL